MITKMLTGSFGGDFCLGPLFGLVASISRPLVKNACRLGGPAPRQARDLRAKLEGLQLKHPPHAAPRQPAATVGDGMIRLAQENQLMIKEKVNMAQDSGFFFHVFWGGECVAIRVCTYYVEYSLSTVVSTAH